MPVDYPISCFFTYLMVRYVCLLDTAVGYFCLLFLLYLWHNSTWHQRHHWSRSDWAPTNPCTILTTAGRAASLVWPSLFLHLDSLGINVLARIVDRITHALLVSSGIFITARMGDRLNAALSVSSRIFIVVRIGDRLTHALFGFAWHLHLRPDWGPANQCFCGIKWHPISSPGL